MKTLNVISATFAFLAILASISEKDYSEMMAWIVVFLFNVKDYIYTESK